MDTKLIYRLNNIVVKVLRTEKVWFKKKNKSINYWIVQFNWVFMVPKW